MDKKLVHELASELFISLTDEDERMFLEAFSAFEQNAKLLDLPGVDDVQPLVFPFTRVNTYLREDEVLPTPSRDEILKNSKNKKGDYVVIPKVVK